MNARHKQWGQNVDTTEGKIFEEILREEDTSLLDSERPTHYHLATDSYTTIDLTITSIECCLDFSHIVLDSLQGSDHYWFLIEIIVPVQDSEPSFSFKIGQADWSKFRNLTNIFIQDEHLDINGKTDNKTNHIINPANNSIPVSSSTSKKLSFPWWNKYCKDAKTNQWRCVRALKQNAGDANKIAYNRIKTICRKTLKDAKKASWQLYASSINVSTSMEKILKRTMKIKCRFQKKKKFCHYWKSLQVLKLKMLQRLAQFSLRLSRTYLQLTTIRQIYNDLKI